MRRGRHDEAAAALAAGARRVHAGARPRPSGRHAAAARRGRARRGARRRSRRPSVAAAARRWPAARRSSARSTRGWSRRSTRSGGCTRGSGRHDEALAAYGRARQLCEQGRGAAHLDTAWAQVNEAQAVHAAGEPRRALALYGEALTRLQAHGSAGNEVEARVGRVEAWLDATKQRRDTTREPHALDASAPVRDTNEPRTPGRVGRDGPRSSCASASAASPRSPVASGFARARLLVARGAAARPAPRSRARPWPGSAASDGPSASSATRSRRWLAAPAE
jgi:hypothetical protein